jgi:ATP-dependent exoDNAse (exonuclease V) beta subunit
VRAIILDFKSDAVAGGADLAAVAERYRPQMVLYRDALSQILRLKAAKILLRLVFVHPGKVIDLTS